MADCHMAASKNGGACLSLSYTNTTSKLHWKCAQDHEWHATLASVRSINTWCPTCADQATWKWTMNDAIKWAETNKGIFLDKDFTKGQRYYNWQCKNKHDFSMKFSSILKGRWCPKCKFKTEQKVRTLFEELTGEPFPQKGPKWLVNPKTKGRMKLDGYCEKLKLAFEYDGEFHFIESTYFATTLKEQKERDALKNELCIANNITLIRISCYDDIEHMVREKLKGINKA
jgi:hypothetical protein